MGWVLVHVRLYGQMYYSQQVVQNPPSVTFFLAWHFLPCSKFFHKKIISKSVNTSEDRQKGQSRNVTRRNTNVISDSVSVSLYHSLNCYDSHPSSSDATSLQLRQRTSDVLYFATACTKAILPDSSASSIVTFFALLKVFSQKNNIKKWKCENIENTTGILIEHLNRCGKSGCAEVDMQCIS